VVSPDFFVIGAPKAGTTALHSALARHPQLYLSPVKEPKFYLCGERPPARRAHRGPGDAHSRHEWVWRRERYAALFAGAPEGTLRGESTPFYLSDPAALARIHADRPDAKLVAVLRDPVDRAYSNWMHLWSDGLETEPDVVRAVAAEDARRAAGYAPFWHYRRLGLYGEQLQALYEVFPRSQVHLLRYRDLVDTPAEAVGAVCAFLGVEAADPPLPRGENTRPFAPDTPRTRRLARLARAGAWTGQWFPPRAWRVAARPLLRALQATDAARPTLAPEQRAELLRSFEADIRLLEQVTGADYSDWRRSAGRGSFADRRDPALSPLPLSQE